MLHKNLDNLLHARKVSKTDFSAHLGIARSTLNKYLSGEWSVPSDIIEKSAAYFNVSVGYLFGETQQDKSLKTIINKQQKQINELTKQVQLIAKSLQMKFS